LIYLADCDTRSSILVCLNRFRYVNGVTPRMRDVCEEAVFTSRDRHNRAHALSRLTGTLGCGPRPGPPRTPRRTPAPGAHPSPCPGRSRTSSPARRWPPTCPRRPPAGSIVTQLRTTMGPGRCENAGGSQSAPMLRATTVPVRWPRRSPAPRCRTAAIGRGRRHRPRLHGGGGGGR
jgi:hypothetical protein